MLAQEECSASSRRVFCACRRRRTRSVARSRCRVRNSCVQLACEERAVSVRGAESRACWWSAAAWAGAATPGSSAALPQSNPSVSNLQNLQKTGVRLRGLKSARRRGLDMFTGYARAARRARLGWFRWMGGTATGSEGGERGLVASHVASRIQATRTY